MRLFLSFTLFLFIFLYSSQLTPAQQIPDSDSLIQTANQLHDSGDYPSAIALLGNVLKTDPNYPVACYEMALNYYAAGENISALEKCREARFLRYEEPYLYSLTGSILDDQGLPDEGVKIIKQGLKKWPFNQNLMYNLGVTYLNAGKPDSAEIILLKAVTFYPYHTRSHLGLAGANYAMGRIAQSYLAYNMAILISPNTANITEYESAIGGKLKTIPKPYKYPYPDGTNTKYWDDLKHLLQSELAFNKSFEYDYMPDFTFTRQSFMLFKNLQYNPTDTSIYNRLYTRLFLEILNTGKFETFINYCMNQLQYQGSEVWSNKNPGKIDAFVSWAQEFINKGRLSGYDPELQKLNKEIHHFEEQKLSSIGEKTGTEGIKNGKFYIISDDGGISEYGTYINDLTEGKWYVLWPDGKIRQELSFINDQMQDTIRTFYPNGAIDLKLAMRNGKRNGKVSEYSGAGRLIQQNTFSDGVMDGPGVYFNFKEKFKREYTYKNDTTNGKTTETWLNGKQKAEYFTQKGLYEGLYRSWYHNGKPESEIFYVKGIKTGPWRNYYYNGVISDSGSYDENGNFSGGYWSYGDNGKLLSVADKYIDGKLTGSIVHYFDNGKERSRLIYKNDSLLQITCYNDQGKVLYKTDAVNDSIYFKSFYGDGIPAMEGFMYHGQNEGLWKTYNPSGSLISEYRYKDGMYSGPQKTYYASGALKEEYVSDSNSIVGIYKSWFANGHLHTSGNYVKEGADGEYVFYFQNDSVSSRSFYSRGKQVGRSILYNPDGRISSEEFYNTDGLPVRNIMYDQSGKVRAEWIYDFGSYEFVVRYPNGNTKSITRISDNVKNGLQEEYFPNGQLSYTGSYIHGEPDGIAKTFDFKGRLESSYNYILGKAEGECNSYYEGKPSYKIFNENGIENGKTIDYFDFNGKVAKEINTHNDERNGFSDYFTPSGDFMYRVRYDQDCIKGYTWKNASGSFVPEVKVDLKTAEMLALYPNGKISARISLKNGLYDGKTITYYSTGGIHSESEYKNDEITGIQKMYFPDGRTRQIKTYMNNEENGPYSCYFENGKLKISGSFENGRKHGDWHIYNESGRETEILKYYYGELYEIIAK